MVIGGDCISEFFFWVCDVFWKYVDEYDVEGCFGCEWSCGVVLEVWWFWYCEIVECVIVVFDENGGYVDVEVDVEWSV